MKTIFRFVSFGVLLAAFIAVGNMAGFAQDPCADTDGMTALDAKVRDLITKKTLPELKARVEAAKQFLEKYGACEPQKEFAQYLKDQIPVWEKRATDMTKADEFQKVLVNFDAAVKAENWDQVYTLGGQILAERPDDFRAVELVLGSIGVDETGKNPPVTRWSE